MDPRFERYTDGYSRSRSGNNRQRRYSNGSASSNENGRSNSRVSNRSRATRDVVRCRTPPPLVKRIVERVPTPEPAIIERVVVRPAPQTIVERVIERPRTPPPRVVNREVTESPQPTIVRTRVIKVDSRTHFNHRNQYERYNPSCYSRAPSVSSRRSSRYRTYTSDEEDDVHSSAGLNYWDDMRNALPRVGRSISPRTNSSYRSRNSSASSIHRLRRPYSRSSSFDVLEPIIPPQQHPVRVPAYQMPTYNNNQQAHIQYQQAQMCPQQQPMHPMYAGQQGIGQMIGTSTMMPTQQYPYNMNTACMANNQFMMQQQQQQQPHYPTEWINQQQQQQMDSQRVINLPTVQLQPAQMPFYGFRPMPPSY